MLQFDSDSIYVESTAHLEVLCDQARHARRVGVDLEFIRERSYFAKLALVQIAVEDSVWLIDPLHDAMDLAPLESLMEAPEVCKIMHAPDQDLEIFFHRRNRPPQNIFDTQKAAAMLGMGHQIAYSNLVFKCLGVQLRHSEGFTNWLRRPLTRQQEAYAQDDVRHLFALQARLTERLGQMGRLEWLHEECRHFEDRDRYDKPPDKLFRQVKSRNKLCPRGLAILRELACWREGEAKRRDKLRRAVVLDEVLVSIARSAPRERGALVQLREFRLKDRRSQEEILAAVQRGLEVLDSDCPKPHRGVRLDKKVDLVVDLLKVSLKILCQKQNIASSVVGNAADIERLVRDVVSDQLKAERHSLLQGWRGRMVGSALLKILHGETGIRVNSSFAPEFQLHEESSVVSE